MRDKLEPVDQLSSISHLRWGGSPGPISSSRHRPGKNWYRVTSLRTSQRLPSWLWLHQHCKASSVSLPPSGHCCSSYKDPTSFLDETKFRFSATGHGWEAPHREQRCSLEPTRHCHVPLYRLCPAHAPLGMEGRLQSSPHLLVSQGPRRVSISQGPAGD